MIELNPKLKKEIELRFSNKPKQHEALLYVLSLYFDLPSYLFDKMVMNIVNASGIFSIDNKGKLEWKFPPIIGSEKDYEIPDDLDGFIEKYRNIWKRADSSKAGDKGTIKKKLLKFLKTHDVTLDEILEAAERYVTEVVLSGSTTYLQNANYFIKKESNPPGSKLETYLELIKEEKSKSNTKETREIDPWKNIE